MRNSISHETFTHFLHFISEHSSNHETSPQRQTADTFAATPEPTNRLIRNPILQPENVQNRHKRTTMAHTRRQTNPHIPRTSHDFPSAVAGGFEPSPLNIPCSAPTIRQRRFRAGDNCGLLIHCACVLNPSSYLLLSRRKLITGWLPPDRRAAPNLLPVATKSRDNVCVRLLARSCVVRRSRAFRDG